MTSNPNNRLKKLAKARQQLTGEPYSEARRRVGQGHGGPAGPHRTRNEWSDDEWDLPGDDWFRSAVQGGCSDLRGTSVGQNPLRLAGGQCDNVRLPAYLLFAEIGTVVPDMGTALWNLVEEYEFGNVVGIATVEADVSFVGSVAATAIAGDPTVTITEADETRHGFV